LEGSAPILITVTLGVNYIKEPAMRVAVTGGAGFIGSHLIERLIGRGDEVICVERPGASRRWIADVPLEWMETGIHDHDALRRTFDGVHVVFHLAGLTEARTAADFYAVNTEGTARVLRAAAAHNGAAPRVVLLSSIAAVGPCRDGERLSPDSVPLPLSHYGNSKLLAEAVVHAYADRVPTTIVRLPSVYGPRERGVLKFFQLVCKGIAITIGSWDRELSMIYVDDVVSGLLAAVEGNTASGRVYYLAHPTPVTWRQFAVAVGRVVDRDPVLMSLPRALAQAVAVTAEGFAALRRRAAILNRERVREISQRRWVCDPSRAMREIGFQPTIPVPVGVARTAAWYREARWI
jgi:nucleoside-diphosphate-sugar epimerase